MTVIVIAFSSVIFLLASILTVLHARSAVISEVASTLKLAEQMLRLNSQKEEAVNVQQLDNIRHLRVDIARNNSTPVDLSSAQLTISGVPWPFVHFVLPEKQYLSLQLKTLSGNHFFLLADPSDEIKESWNETRTFLVLLLGLTLAISLAVFFVVGRALKPVKVILEGLGEIKSGEFHQRLPDFYLPEYSAISSAFNTMVENLEHSQQQNRVLNEKMFNVQERERKALARDLHDEMGQSLTAMKALCASAKHYSPAQEVDDHLTSINLTCDSLFKVVRNMMQQLTPPLLDEFGLMSALEELVDKWQVQKKCLVCLEVDPQIQGFQSENDIHLFRVVQESLTNALKHSGANNIIIRLDSYCSNHGKSAIKLTIIDNGNGFDLARVERGIGLNGICERAKSINAKLEIDSQLGKGTTVTLST